VQYLLQIIQDHTSVFTSGLFMGMQDVQPPSEPGQVPLFHSSTSLFCHTATAHPSHQGPSPDHGDVFLPGSPWIPNEVYILPAGIGIAHSSQFLALAALPTSIQNPTTTTSLGNNQWGTYLHNDHQSYDIYKDLPSEQGMLANQI
jgi:hypothetical protein